MALPPPLSSLFLILGVHSRSYIGLLRAPSVLISKLDNLQYLTGLWWFGWVSWHRDCSRRRRRRRGRLWRCVASIFDIFSRVNFAQQEVVLLISLTMLGIKTIHPTTGALDYLLRAIQASPSWSTSTGPSQATTPRSTPPRWSSASPSSTARWVQGVILQFQFSRTYPKLIGPGHSRSLMLELRWAHHIALLILSKPKIPPKLKP